VKDPRLALNHKDAICAAHEVTKQRPSTWAEFVAMLEPMAKLSPKIKSAVEHHEKCDDHHPDLDDGT
jgi:hypothetical protein